MIYKIVATPSTLATDSSHNEVTFAQERILEVNEKVIHVVREEF